MGRKMNALFSSLQACLFSCHHFPPQQKAGRGHSPLTVTRQRWMRPLAGVKIIRRFSRNAIMLVLLPVDVDVSQDGRRLLFGCHGIAIRIWDIDACGESAVIPTGLHVAISTLHFSPDNVHVLVAGSDGSISLWDTAAERLCWRNQEAHGRPVSDGFSGWTLRDVRKCRLFSCSPGPADGDIFRPTRGYAALIAELLPCGSEISREIGCDQSWFGKLRCCEITVIAT